MVTAISGNELIKKINAIKNAIITIPPSIMINELTLCLITACSLSNSSFGKHKFINTPAYDIKTLARTGNNAITIKLKIDRCKTNFKIILQINDKGETNKILNKTFAFKTVCAGIGMLRKIQSCLPSSEIENAAG